LHPRVSQLVRAVCKDILKTSHSAKASLEKTCMAAEDFLESLSTDGEPDAATQEKIVKMEDMITEMKTDLGTIRKALAKAKTYKASDDNLKEKNAMLTGLNACAMAHKDA
jgi:hypothetical protein